MSETRTAGKWYQGEGDYADTIYVNYGAANGGETPIAICTNKNAEGAEDNAAYIVEAVNAHDALTAENARLREALTNLTGWYDLMPEGWRGYGTYAVDLRKANQQARAALAEVAK